MKNFLSGLLLGILLPGAAVYAAAQTEKPAEKAAPQSKDSAANHGQAYYHYSLAHMYEEMAITYNRTDYLTRAIEEYKQALKYDPDSPFLSAELADLYARSGRINDAVTEAEDTLKRDPNNLDARRLLGRIYLRVLGDPREGRVQGDALNRAIEQYQKICAADPKDVDSMLTLGRLYRINNDFSKAEAILKKALEQQPDSEDALTTLALLYSDTNQFQRAVELLEKVTSRNNNPKLFAALGSAYEQARQYDKAVLAYRKALQQDRDNPEYLRALGQNLVYNEEYDEALSVYKSLMAADPQDGTAFLRMGQIYRQQRKFDLAAENLQKAASLMPDNLEVPYNQALLYETQGQTEEAIKVMKGLLDRTAKPNKDYTARDKANRAIFLERLGALYMSAENYTAAADAFRGMMDADQENAVRGAGHVIEALRQAHQLPKALAEAEAAIKRFPDERSLKLAHGSLLGEMGQPDKATEEMKALIQNKPDDREVYLSLAQVNERAKRFPQAEEAIAAAEKLSSSKDEKEFVYFLWGSILERQKKYDAAETEFKKALAVNPKSAMTLNYLGYMLADRGVRLEEGKKYIEAALDQDPQNGAYMDSLGWVYFKMNRLDLAEEYLLKAIQRISKDVTIHDHLGDVYYQTGRIREAQAQWQKALAQYDAGASSDTDPADIAKIQKKLENARVRLAQETGKKQD